MEIKVIGMRRRTEEPDPNAPEESLKRAVALQAQADLLNPYPRPRGFVYKARTWDEYARWRSDQANPRLW